MWCMCVCVMWSNSIFVYNNYNGNSIRKRIEREREKERQVKRKRERCVCMCVYLVNNTQFHIFRKLSHDPVATAIPSSVTPKHDTLLSCPARTPARSAFIESQTLQLKSS